MLCYEMLCYIDTDVGQTIYCSLQVFVHGIYSKYLFMVSLAHYPHQ